MMIWKKYFTLGFRIIVAMSVQLIDLAAQEQNPQGIPPKFYPKQYFVDLDGDGTYENLQVENEPIPSKGKEEFSRYLSSLIKYPYLAAENGIAGIVTLSVLIDEKGKVLNVDIVKSLSKDCDEAAKKAFIQATANGYAPLILNSKPVKYKMEFSVHFWLG